MMAQLFEGDRPGRRWRWLWLLPVLEDPGAVVLQQLSGHHRLQKHHGFELFGGAGEITEEVGSEILAIKSPSLCWWWGPARHALPDQTPPPSFWRGQAWPS